jgi:hypothetical protein
VGDHTKESEELKHVNAWDEEGTVRLAFESIGKVHESYGETHNPHLATGAVCWSAQCKMQEPLHHTLPMSRQKLQGKTIERNLIGKGNIVLCTLILYFVYVMFIVYYRIKDKHLYAVKLVLYASRFLQTGTDGKM